MLLCEAFLGWWQNTLGLPSVPHKVMVAMVYGIVHRAVMYLFGAAMQVLLLNAAIKALAVHFESLPKHVSNVAVRSSEGLLLGDVRDECGAPTGYLD